MFLNTKEDFIKEFGILTGERLMAELITGGPGNLDFDYENFNDIHLIDVNNGMSNKIKFLEDVDTFLAASIQFLHKQLYCNQILYNIIDDLQEGRVTLEDIKKPFWIVK